MLPRFVFQSDTNSVFSVLSFYSATTELRGNGQWTGIKAVKPPGVPGIGIRFLVYQIELQARRYIIFYTLGRRGNFQQKRSSTSEIRTQYAQHWRRNRGFQGGQARPRTIQAPFRNFNDNQNKIEKKNRYNSNAKKNLLNELGCLVMKN